MSITRDIDYAEFDRLFVEKIIRDEFGGEAGRAVLERMIRKGATTQDMVGRLRQLLPTWEGRATQLEVVVNYLIADGRTNGGGQ